MPTPLIAPSILAADFACLADEASRMRAAGAQWLHVDVMDGHFVPNLTIGAPVVKALRRHTDAYLDTHLMVSEPERWVEDFAAAGADGYTFHIEATTDAGALISRIHAAGMRAGIAIKPATPVEALFPYAGLVHLALVMTVEPGFGGQPFMPAMLEKVKTLRARFPELNVQVDGGVGLANIDAVAAAGANVIVAGTSVFGSKDPAHTISRMMASLTAAAPPAAAAV